MVDVSREEFEDLVSEAIDKLPEKYLMRLENVAFIVEDEPTKQQRLSLKLSQGETLFGLYEGAPLPTRMGQAKMLPDKITLFKSPLAAASGNIKELKENIRHTLWHEVAHYFGLDHTRIDELDKR